MPSAFAIAGIAPVQFTLSDAIIPEYLRVAVFDGSIDYVDPLAAPDRSFVCSPTVDAACTTSVQDNSLLVSLPGDALPRSGSVVVSIGAEYLAEPELHSERFVNTVSWVLPLDIR